MLQKWRIEWRVGKLKNMRYLINMIYKEDVIWKAKTKSKQNYTTLLNLKEEPIYKYSCIVPNKNENLLMLESAYNDQFHHVFSDGHIEIESDLFYLYKLLICSRTIEQIRLQIHQSFCAYETHFINNIKNINWPLYIPFSSTFIKPQINIQCIKSRLYHTSMLKNIILNVIQRQQQIYIEKHGDENILLKKKKKNPSQLEPLKIHVLLRYNECKININVSSDLNKRIYQFSKTQDSLKSTIVAAAFLKVQLFKYINSFQNLFIIDPFCNDGTLLLEIISILLSVPNGSPSIIYPICNFPLHSPSTFYDVLNQLTIKSCENLNQVYILGIEEKQENIRKAKKNWKHFLKTLPLKTSEHLNALHMENGKNEISDEENDKESDNGSYNGSYNGNDNENQIEKEIKSDHIYDNYKKYDTLTTYQLNNIFHNSVNKEKKNINSTIKSTDGMNYEISISDFALNHVKFYSKNFLHFNNVIGNCVIFTNITNLEKKKIKKLENLILRSDLVATYVFAKEKFKEQTELKFRLILRFISSGQNIVFLQLFSKRKKNIFTDEQEEEEE